MPTINFKGISFVQNHHLAVKYHQLVPKKELSVTDKVSLHDNLIIQGDNLKALKSLLPTYGGKVKVVCIDPPYNTGEEGWKYNDNVNSPMIQEWLKSNKPVDKEDLARHEKWLCMMMPRLKLLKELMATDGIIAIAIDDNEVFYLGSLMDELFGEHNRLACAPWLAEPSGGKEKTGLRKGHEYIMIYCNGDKSKVSQEERSTGELDKKDKFGKFRKGRELIKWGDASLRADREDMWFELIAPDGTKVVPIRNDGKEGRWRWGQKNPKTIALINDHEHAHWEMREYDEGVSIDGKKERWMAYEKIRDKKKSVGWNTWLDSYGFNADGTRTLKDIFGRKEFDTPKPVQLFEWLISLHEDDNAIVLDSFAGSGTAAHAVLNLNDEDEGGRRFILVEMENEVINITTERVKRVIKGVDSAKDERIKNGVSGTFSYFELGEPIEMESILHGDNLPSYADLARYLFYTATGEEFSPNKLDEKKYFIGSSKDYEVYLFYQPDVEYLKSTALTLERAKSLGVHNGIKRLVFAPAKFLDTHTLLELRIDYCQLPFEIYRLKG
ncbi:MAG: site-specific DNA-methyltransferase [Bacteroidetes bacterium]|nr:MAG: site-specific DNA-methyltransferase [Bacteroidota bacterium]